MTTKENKDNKGNKPEVRIERMNTDDLLNSKKHTDKLAGIVRVLGDLEYDRAKVTTGNEQEAKNKSKRQTITNKTSKPALSLRFDDNEGEKMEKTKKLASKVWGEIQVLKKDSSKELSKEVQELYDLLVSFGKAKQKELPTKMEF